MNNADAKKTCLHRGLFNTQISATYLSDIGQVMFSVDRINCASCGQTMKFLGVRAGMCFYEPRTNPTSTTLNVPIAAWDGKVADVLDIDKSRPS